MFLAGLKPPESKVPVLDPYRYRQLLLDRWINRASKRLGDLASLKYGSVKEFFRVIQSVERAVSTRIQIATDNLFGFQLRYTERLVAPHWKNECCAGGGKRGQTVAEVNSGTV